METLSSGPLRCYLEFSGTSSSWWYPHGNLIMSSTWIFDRRYGYYAARFGGAAKVLTKLLRSSFYSNSAE